MPPELPGFDFLGLPREIRDQVYDLVWATKQPVELALPQITDHSRVEKQLFVFKVTYAVHGPLIDTTRTHIHPRYRRMWLLANRQICSEAIEQFQRKSTWSFTGEKWYANGDARFLSVWKNPNPRRKSARLGPHLLTPHCATTIETSKRLVMMTMAETDHSENPIFPLKFCNEDPKFLQRLDSSLATATALRTLNICMAVKTFPYRSSSSLTNVNFQPLHNLDLPSLQDVEMEVLYMEPVSWQGRAMFEKCLEQLCMDLIGGSGVADNRINSLDPPLAVYKYERRSTENSSSKNREESTGLLDWPVDD